MTDDALIYDPSRPLDPLGDGERQASEGVKKNYGKVGSARPSRSSTPTGPAQSWTCPTSRSCPRVLTTGIASTPGGTVPHPFMRRLSSMWCRCSLAPRCANCAASRTNSSRTAYSRDGADLGVPARVFPQWLRCTGCDRLAPVGAFDYRNTSPFRPDEAAFEHTSCHGRRLAASAGTPTGGSVSRSRKARRQPAVTARYLLACPDGHLDEFLTAGGFTMEVRAPPGWKPRSSA